MCLAIPGRVATIFVDESFGLRTGKVEFGGIRRDVCLAYVPEAQIGDYVLVHVGFAITIIDEQEAQRVYEFLSGLGQLDELQEDSMELSVDAPANKDGS
jgi:hydrogenase expression/formation protein HypC